jgi:hypothetical protein
MLLVTLGVTAIFLILLCVGIVIYRGRIISAVNPETYQAWLDIKQKLIRFKLSK